MSFIQRELDRINEAIRSDKTSLEDHAKLYAAQQALAWATDPEGYASPYNSIFKIDGKPVTGVPQSETDLCQSFIRKPVGRQESSGSGVGQRPLIP